MESDLKIKFDLIVLGTGFVESLVAAAAARIGKKVLHLDRNGFYGGQWASFSLTALQEWAESLKEKKDTSSTDEFPSDLLDKDEAVCALSLPSSTYYGTKYQWHVLEKAESTEVEETLVAASEEEKASETKANPASEGADVETKEKETWSKNELEKLNRKFNVDLAPKILFSRGALVELLISSNVARYVEFKCITRVLTWAEEENEDSSLNGKLISVPCSRGDVFTTDVISLVEKRLLMKFLEFCYSYEQNQEEWSEYSEKPFKDFLTSRSLTPKLIHFITSAIGMVEDDVNCSEGLRKTSLFLNSLGRYGTMPFLFTLYGSGEMPQAFCRLCAVFEGTYILRRNVERFIIDEEGCVSGVTSEGQRFKGGSVVMDVGYAPTTFKTSAKRKQSVSRGIFVTDKSIMADEKEHVTVLRMPSSNKDHTAVTVIEVGSGCAVCPKNTYLVHLLCGGEDAESDLKTTINRLFNQPEQKEENKPNILFSLYFNQVIYDQENSSMEGLPPNVHLCSGPDAALDYDEAILQAKSIFSKIFPGEDFLPRAPDHNDIVFNSSDENLKASSEMEDQGSGGEGEAKEETVGTQDEELGKLVKEKMSLEIKKSDEKVEIEGKEEEDQ